MSSFRIGFRVYALLLAGIFGRVSNAPCDDGKARTQLEVAAYRIVLTETIREDRVDYLTLRADHLEALRRFLAGFGEIDFPALDDATALAAGIDLYNATVLEAIASRIALGYRVDEGEFGLFKEPRIQLGKGDPISLDHLEHQILRKRFPGGAIHAGLVCGAVSCPPLEAEPYLGRDAVAVLEKRMGDFLRDPKRNGIDRATKTLELSRLFDWFAADFGGKEQVARFVAKYLGPEVAEYRVTHREYDWALNFTAPPENSKQPRFLVFRKQSTPTDGLNHSAILELRSAWDLSESQDTTAEVRLPSGKLARVPRRDLEVFHNL